MPRDTDHLNPEEALGADEALKSLSGRYQFVYQADGNLVLYRNRDGDRTAIWGSRTDGLSVGRCVMQADGNLVVYDGAGAPRWASETWRHPGSKLIVQNDGNAVIYTTNGAPVWATNTAELQSVRTGFDPRRHGFHFSNTAAEMRVRWTVPIPGRGATVIEAPSGGMCGGFVFAARDIYDAGREAPRVRAAPNSGVIYDYLLIRLAESFGGMNGVARYLALMNPSLPNHETTASRMGITPHGRAWIMINEEWPRIRAELDGGHPATMALVHAVSFDPFALGNNHQVLATGYDLDPTELTLHVYDPNSPDEDTTMRLDIRDPEHTTVVRWGGVSKIWCFFKSDWSFRDPGSMY